MIRRHAPSGMVCAIDHLASGAGVAVMRAGGTAADAAVATSAVLAVTTQHMCGMGGDLLAVVAPPGAQPQALESAGVAGSGADPDRLRSEGHTTMPFRDDIRAVTVPGCVDGWLALHERHGALPLAEVLAPAIAYARDGFPVSPLLAASIPRVAHLPDAADYLPNGVPAAAGTRIRRPGVARALEAVAAGGRDGFYGGEFGAGLLEVGGGEFAPADLGHTLARWLEPLSVDAWGHRLWTSPPVSQGYLTLAAAWIASGLDVPADPADPRWAHLLVEASRQAGWDRSTVLHDGADGPALVDPAVLGPRRAVITTDTAAVLPSVSYGPGDTVALTAVDRNRLGVALVQSNASGFGAHLVVPGVRIFLHNRGIGFSLAAGHPGEYRPGRRPAHTLSPLAVTRPDGSLALVAGTMGGDSQPQILLQILARYLVAGQDPADAVGAPRWTLTSGATDSSGAAGPATGFDTWDRRGDVRVLLEGGAHGWASGLRSRGHTVAALEPLEGNFGHAHAIGVVGDVLAGGSDPRAVSGAAAGY